MDPIEHIELTSQDEEDLAKLLSEGKAPDYHTILEVWRETLVPAETELVKRVTPTWAARIVASYTGVSFADMNLYRDTYFGMFIELLDILRAEIDTDEECLKFYSPADDAENNANHYKNVLRDWQKALLLWELEWDCTDPAAPVKLAAIAEVHKAVFGPTGITQFLDNIGLEFNESDQVEMGEALNEYRLSVEAALAKEDK